MLRHLFVTLAQILSRIRDCRGSNSRRAAEQEATCAGAANAATTEDSYRIDISFCQGTIGCRVYNRRLKRTVATGMSRKQARTLCALLNEACAPQSGGYWRAVNSLDRDGPIPRSMPTEPRVRPWRGPIP
jgi:hypothetical protein